MLRRLLPAACGLALALLAQSALAQDDDEPDDGIRRPERVTAGIADQLLGQLSPDGKSLYFVSTRNTTHEIYVQDMASGRSTRLFDESADVTWPRVSPDGKSILYVSFRDEATGQLCVRDLPRGGGRRCLKDARPAIQAEWIDKARVALVARASIEGDFQVLEVNVDSKPTARLLFGRNLTTPATSPDGRWLLYVPIERTAQHIGPAFASKAGNHMEIARLDGSGSPVKIDIDLPGQCGQPVFSPDGRFVYFVQFFSDTNHDGVIDADDHGVLFRMPMSLGAAPRAGVPEQLTDTAWNCQYPAPTKTLLFATCAPERNVDIYSLPLDGEVPSEWDAARLRTEELLAGKKADEQMLYSRRLPKETDVSAKRLVMANLVRLHLSLDEFRAAAFYAEHIQQLKDSATAGMSRSLVALVEQRHAVRNRERGRLSEDFFEDAQKRLDSLTEEPTDSRGAIALMHVVRSEIADGMGDKTRAQSELARAVVDDATPRAVLRFYYERADAIHRELDDRDALADVCKRLSLSRAFEPDEQLDFARAAVRAMTRGLPYDTADAVLARERPKAPEGSELAFAIDLGRAVLANRDGDPPESVKSALLALYSAQVRPDRRHALVFDAVKRATLTGAERITEALAIRYVEDAKPGTAEKRRAERMYRRALNGRAYRRVADGRSAEALQDFDSVVDKTGSLEAVMASIDLRLRRGDKPAAIRAVFARQSGAHAASLTAFVEAYLASIELPALEGRAFDEKAKGALDTLRAQWSELKNKRVVRAVYGSILQQMHLRSGDVALAERANVHDLVALDLAAKNARYRAMILGELGLLHSAVGNYQIALSYLLPRDKIPYADDAPSLGVRLATARALLHAGKDEEAARAADESLAMTDRAPALAEYRVVALERAALYNLSAGKFDRALQLYDLLAPIVDRATALDANAKRNRFVVHLARAAAAVGAKKPDRALPDLDLVDGLGRDPAMAVVIKWPHASVDHVVASYRAVIAGLRANAYGEQGALELQNRALVARRDVFAERFAKVNRNEYLRSLSLVEVRLAENADARHDARAAGAWVSSALGHADTLRTRTGSAVTTEQIDVLWLGAALGAPLSFDLGKRLNAASDELVKDPRPELRNVARWFEVYRALSP